MYDYIVTDLGNAAVFSPFADRVFAFPLQQMHIPHARCLLVSGNEDTKTVAKELGMGVLQWEGELKEADLLPHLAWLDPVVTAAHQLFLFDMGNVVVRNITMLGKIARAWKLDRNEFLTDYLHYEFPLMEGEFSSSQYWAHVHQVFGVKVEGDPFYDCFNPIFNEEIVSLVKALRKAGKRVVCASNTIDPHWRILSDMGALSLFDTVYASHEMHLTKPSQAFFQYILEKEGVKAEDAYFIDDNEENISRARSMGISSLLYADRSGRSAELRIAEAFAGIL
ncbi:HAD-IA family hydrolase [Sphaerochaeta sp.]|uniref:HAD-IA family hydrolase n=1 Tax=Sphaerochaeta sp. TaxID=1972642 RepID=UPI003D13DF03